MSYLGGFMGGSPDYNSNPGILGLYNFIQSGYDAGKAKAQNQAIAQLSQKAYTDTGDAQQQDIAQAIGIDPQAGYALAGKAQEQNAAQQAQKLAAFQRLGKAASAIIQAKQAGDETTAEGIYQAIVPELGLMSAQHGGPTPPPTLQGADMGALYKVAAMYASLPQPAKPISVGPDTTLLDGATHKVIYQGAGDAGTAVTGMTYNGMPVFRDKMGHLKDVFGNPIPQGAVQGGVGVGQTGAGAPTGLPAETEAYVTKVTAALNGQPAFDQFGQPTGALLDAVQQVESGGNPNAVSPAGAQGPYQFMPATAASVGVTDPFDPQQARQGAAKYLAQLYQQFGGDANKAIAAYNAGPGRVQQATSGQQSTPQGSGLQYTPSGQNANLIAQRQQQIQQLKAAGVDMSPEDQQQYLLTGKASNFQGGSSAALFGDPTKTGADYLKTIPQGNQEIVRGLLDGTVALPTGTTLKSPLWQSALASVKHADPAWNQAAFKQYADTRKWATTGQGGQLINNINTASYHLDKLRADIQALHNGNFSLINKIGNTVSQATGGQAVTNFKADLTPVASELAAVYKGKGVPSDAEIAHFMNALTPDMSYGQQMNVIRGWIDLLTGKLNSTREQYRSGMSKLSSPLSVINPHAAEALERITTLANQVSNTGQHAMPAQDTTRIYAPGGEAQPAPAAAGASSGVDSLLSKYGIQ